MRSAAPVSRPPGCRSASNWRPATRGGSSCLALAVYLIFVALARVQLAAVAIFGALVLTALLRPLVDLLGG